MAFSKLSEAEAIAASRDPRDAELDPTDLDAVVLAAGGDGVVSGCAVTAAGSNSVTIGSGVVRIGGVNYAVAGNAVSMAAASGTHRRYDLVLVGTSGTCTKVDGTAETFAVYPNVTASTVPLYIAPRPTSNNVLATGDLLDMRVPVRFGGEATENLVMDGNTIFGGSADGDTLKLQGNPTDFKDAIAVNSPMVFHGNSPTWAAAGNADGVFAKFAATITMNYASWVFKAVEVGGTVVWAVTPVAFGGPAVFVHSATHKNTASSTLNGALNSSFVFADLATYTADNATFTLGGHTGLTTAPTFGIIGASGVMNVTGVVGVNVGATVNTGATITTLRGIQVGVATGAGTVTTQVGIQIAALSKATNNTAILYGTTTAPSGNWGIYQASTTTNLFSGPLMFGSASGPTMRSGSGTPEAAITAPVGSLYVRTDGGASTTLYVKESGSGDTGWVAK